MPHSTECICYSSERDDNPLGLTFYDLLAGSVDKQQLFRVMRDESVTPKERYFAMEALCAAVNSHKRMVSRTRIWH